MEGRMTGCTKWGEGEDEEYQIYAMVAVLHSPLQVAVVSVLHSPLQVAVVVVLPTPMQVDLVVVPSVEPRFSRTTTSPRFSRSELRRAQFDARSDPSTAPLARSALALLSAAARVRSPLRRSCFPSGVGSSPSGGVLYMIEKINLAVPVFALPIGDPNQPASKVWDWNMYGTKLKKLHGWFLNTANKDGEGGEDNATAILQEDHGDGLKDGSSSGSDDHDDHEDHAPAWEDGRDEIVSCARAVQLLAIWANFHVSAINAYDWHQCRSIYRELEGEEQEEARRLALTCPYRELEDEEVKKGKYLVLTGPYRILEAYGSLGLKIFTPECEESDTDDEGSSTDDGGVFTGPIFEKWDVTEPDEVEEHRRVICGFFGRLLQITYLVIPEAVETHVEVRLNLKDLGSRSRAVYGSVKAGAVAYRNKSIHLFSCERGRSLSVSCGSTYIIPLSPYMIALPYRQHFKLHIDVDLRVITTCDSPEEDKNLKFRLDCSRRIRSQERLEFPRRIRSQKREFDGDQVEVDVAWHLERS
ncbi:hypothetical protein EJB05_38473, partial [Eragrostis curvula]